MPKTPDKMEAMIKAAFKDHKLLQTGPGYSWVVGKPGDSHYRFRVTWAPGQLFLSGDLGEETWTHYHALPDLWGGIFWFAGSNYDYLVSKCTAERVFDRERTVEHLIEAAYRRIREGGHMGLSWVRETKYPARRQGQPLDRDADLMYRICDHYGEDWTTRDGRKNALRTLREDRDLTADDLYAISEDGECLVQSHKPQTRWQHAAVQLWAKILIDTEPAWHKAWRWLKAKRAQWQRFRKSPPLWAPILYQAPKSYGDGHEHFVRKVWAGQDSVSFRHVEPWKLRGRDMSRFGFWRLQGSSTPEDRWRDGSWRKFQDVRPHPGAWL